MDLAVVGGSLSLFSYSAVAAAVTEMAVAVAETAAVVVAATMVAAAADADLTANKRRRSITLRRFFYLSSFSKRFSRRFTIVFSAFMRAYFLSLPSSIVHGAISVSYTHLTLPTIA